MKNADNDIYKEFERASEVILEPRLPVIIRLDGNSFSKLTKKHFIKPFDPKFDDAMDCAAKAVLEYCSGALLAYVQSDEITIILRNDQKENTDPFLRNRVQKLTSLTAATASVAFSREAGLGAVFDARAFTVPNPTDALNVLIWRQEDCFTNAVHSACHHICGQKMGKKTAYRWMHGKGTKDYIAKLEEIGRPLETFRKHTLYGRVIQRKVRESILEEIVDEDTMIHLISIGKSRDEVIIRQSYEALPETPIFKSDPAFLLSKFE